MIDGTPGTTVFMLTYELTSSPWLSCCFVGQGCSSFGDCGIEAQSYRDQKHRNRHVVDQRSDNTQPGSRQNNRRPDIVGDHTHVACLLLPFVIFLHCSSSTSR